jgi:predicted nucleic acid-binding protein
VYTLDTNVIIAYYRRDPRVVPVLREILRDPTSSIYVSTITEAELFSFANLSEEEKDFIEASYRAFLSSRRFPNSPASLERSALLTGSNGRCVYRCHRSVYRQHGAHQQRE